jgi:DNA-directed RNA polymerase specialized sigma24 family protein
MAVGRWVSVLISRVDLASTLSTTPTVDEFLRRERDPLFAALCLIVGDRQEAASIARDAFATVWQRWDRVAWSDPAGALHRVALRSLRRRRKWRSVVQRIAPERIASGEPNLSDTEPIPGVGLAQLPPMQRAALVLEDLWHVDAATAGRALGVSASEIAELVHRARASLSEDGRGSVVLRPLIERELAAIGPAALDMADLKRVRRRRRRRESVASAVAAIALLAVAIAAAPPTPRSARVPVVAVHRPAPVNLQPILVPRSATPLGTRFASSEHDLTALLGDVPAATGLARRAAGVRFLGPPASPLTRTSVEALAVEYDSSVAAQSAMIAQAVSLHFDRGMVRSLPAGLPGADDGMRFVDRSIPRSVVYLWRHEHVLLRLDAGGNLPPGDVRPLALAMDRRAVAAIR